MASPNPPEILDPSLPIAQEGGAWGFVPDEVPDALMQRIYGNASNGQALSTLFGFGSDAQFNGSVVLTNAISQGYNPNTIAPALADALDVSRNRATTIARNEMLGAYRDAQLANFNANKDVISGWMWSCAPDACMVCVFMDGSEHDLWEDMDSHVNCRCAMLPVTKTWDDLFSQYGIDATDIPETSIAYTYQPQLEIFERASPAYQIQTMGRAAWEAWQKGDVQIADLVGARNDPRYGWQVYNKSLKDLGLDYRDYLAPLRVPPDADLYPYKFNPDTRMWERIPEEAPPIPADANLYPYRLNPESNQWERIPEPEGESGIGRPVSAEPTEPSLSLGSVEDIQARVAEQEQFYDGMPIGDPMAMEASEDPVMRAGVEQGKKMLEDVLDKLATRLENDQKFMRLARYLGYDGSMLPTYVGDASWQSATLAEAKHEMVEGIIYDIMSEFHSIPEGTELFVQSDMQIFMQQVVKEQFKLVEAEGYWPAEGIANAEATWGTYRNGFKSFFQAMYDETQAWFQENGISEVQLFRGARWTAEAAPDGISFDGEVIESAIKQAPMTSWSSDPGVALDYANEAGGVARPATAAADRGMVMAVRVPVDQVLSTPFTGFGTPPLRELIVLGEPENVLALPFVADEAPTVDSLIEAFAGETGEAAPTTGAEFDASALPGEWGAKVEQSLGQETASDWADALGEHGNLQGPIADRAEARDWEPLATSRDVSDALHEQLDATVNFDDMHPAIANQFAQTLQVLYADFPEVVDQSIEYVGMADQDWLARFPDARLAPGDAAMAASNGPQIAFNAGYWDMSIIQDGAFTTNTLQENVVDHWFFDGYGSPGATLAHEFGHSLYDWALADESSPIFDMVADFSQKWGNDLVPTLSRYAQTSYKEAFAEAFSASYYGSPEVLADPMVQDMQQLLADIRDVLDAGAGATERDELASEVESQLLPGEFDEAGRKPMLPPGVSTEGESRIRYEEWRMTQEADPTYMVFDANGRPVFADAWNENPAKMEFTPEQQARIDALSKRGIKVSIWKPEGDGLTPGELRWAIENGANQIDVLTPNGIDSLSRSAGNRAARVWTEDWLDAEVMPLMDQAVSDAYAEQLADELGGRIETAETKTPPRVRDYDRIDTAIQREIPQAVWEKIADQVDGLEYEHTDLPARDWGRGTGEIPRTWQPPKPLLEQFDASSLPGDIERGGTLEDGTEWNVHDYVGDTPPNVTDAGAMEGIGSDDGEHWAPVWVEGRPGEWMDVNPRFDLIPGDPNSQCINCRRIWQGPLSGEHPDHWVNSSTGYCQDCLDSTIRPREMRAHFMRNNPDATAEEIDRMTREYMAAHPKG